MLPRDQQSMGEVALEGSIATNCSDCVSDGHFRQGLSYDLCQDHQEGDMGQAILAARASTVSDRKRSSPGETRTITGLVRTLPRL